MNYEKIYNRIIENRQTNPIPKNEYGEQHHIIPKSLSGSNNRSNLVQLTAKEHFICHALLAEMYPKYSNEWFKMNHAFMMMKADSTNSRYINARLYELKRTDFSKTMSFAQAGQKNSQFGKIWMHSKCLKKNVKIDSNSIECYLSNGFDIGRVLNFNIQPKIKNIDQIIMNGCLISVRNKQLLEKYFSINFFDYASPDQVYELIKKLLYDEYIINQNSTNDLSKIFGFSNESARKYLKMFNINIRPKCSQTDKSKQKISNTLRTTHK